MSKVLFVVDVQKEFAKDKQGKLVYDACIDYIVKNFQSYDKVIAAVYVNENNPNMQRLLNWDECKNIRPLDFQANKFVLHSGYSIGDYSFATPNTQVDVIGFDTDACVLSACFDLFNHGANFRILSKYVYSSGGKDMHKAGLAVMKRQFGKALQ